MCHVGPANGTQPSDKWLVDFSYSNNVTGGTSLLNLYRLLLNSERSHHYTRTIEVWSFKVDYSNNRPVAPVLIAAHIPEGESVLMSTSDYQALTTPGGKGFLLSYDYVRL
jgi:hypothetical protein